MRYFALLFAIAFIGCNEQEQKTAATTASAHSDSFNQSIDKALNDYYSLSEAFVNWDSTGVSSSAASFGEKIAQVSLAEIKDTSEASEATALIGCLAESSQSIAAPAGLEARRHGFNQLTEDLVSFLTAVRYDAKPLYLQKCPMAFNDTETAVWLTDKGKDSIRNPYLGLHHPKYHDGMLECGSNKSTIDFQRK